MPFKNASPYIAEAVESVRLQSFADFELLAIDDHSTDDSAAIVESFCDRRVRVVRSDGNGVSAALNTGIRLRSAGVRYIARHDADDISEPERLGAQLAYFTTHPDLSVLATNATYIDVHGNRTGVSDTPLADREIVASLRRHNPICHGSVMFAAADVLAAGGYDTAYPLAQGYELWVRMARQGFRFGCLPDHLYRYRRYDGSWTHSRRFDRDRIIQNIAEQAAATLSSPTSYISD